MAQVRAIFALVPARSGITDPTYVPSKPLIEGRFIRCPHCLELRDPNQGLKPYERNEEYAMDLGVVYQCRKDRGGCGHVFAPSDQRILLAFLNGDLIPRDRLEEAKARIAELEAQLGEVQIPGEPLVGQR